MRRLLFPNTLEGDCLPSGEFAVASRGGPVYTHLGEISGPPGDAVRYVRITTVGGFKMAGIGQNTPATWEWLEADRQWHDRGPSHGVSACIYDLAGTLHIFQFAGEGTPSQGYRYVAPDGRLVRGDETYNSGELRLAEYTPAGPFIVGQGWDSGVEALYAGARYALEPGETTVVRASFDGTTLAMATRKLRENETVVTWRTVDEATAHPIVPEDGGNTGGGTGTGGGNGGNEPGGGTGGGRMRLVPITQADFAGAEIINGPQGIKGWAEVGNVTLVRFTGGQMLCDFSFRRVLPPVFPGGGVPQQPEKRPPSTDIGPGDPIRFCDVLFCKTDDGRTRGIVFARDHHDDPSPFEATKDISHWAADVFRRTPLEGVDYREGDSVGIAFFAGSPYRTRDDEPEAVGTKHWRTNMAIVQISTNKEYTWAPMPLPEDGGGQTGGGNGGNTGGGGTGGGGDTGGTDQALAARVGVHDQQIGDILRFIDGPGGIREYMKAHAGDSSGQTVDLGPLTKRVEALEQADKQTAHKGDGVTIAAKLPLVGNVKLHGSIDA